MLTVGACSKRHPPDSTAGENFAAYSGAGPTADGRIKPEIMTVGGVATDQIFSCRSDQQSGYIGMQGTSLAAPLAAGVEVSQLTWGSTYEVRVTVRNLGDDQALGTIVRLKYTLPWTAPNAWHEAEDASHNPLVRVVDVPALGQTEVPFQWRPEAAEIGAPPGTSHFCLLAEVDHVGDPLVYPAPTTAGGDAWSANIKGVNNVALRNVHIQ